MFCITKFRNYVYVLLNFELYIVQYNLLDEKSPPIYMHAVFKTYRTINSLILHIKSLGSLSLTMACEIMIVMP